MITHQKRHALCIAGHDPTGGAGISADITTLSTFGVHPLSVITANTVQTSARCTRWQKSDVELVDQQLSSLISHTPIHVIKIGMIGSVDIGEVIKKHLSKLSRHIPVVLDPVLASEEHDSLSEQNLPRFIAEELVPLCTLITPNTREFDSVRRHTPALQTSPHWTLITGTHDDSTPLTIEHRLFNASQEKQYTFVSERLPQTFHGSGCTLASAIAALLALEHDLPEAVSLALTWTHRTLQTAYLIDSARVAIPNRSQPLPLKYTAACDAIT